MPRPGGGSPMAPPRARGAGRLLPRSSHFAPPPHPAYRSRIRGSAASGAVAKCGPWRHSRALCPCLALDSAVLAGPAAASGPGGRFRPGRLLRPGCSLRPRPPLPTQPGRLPGNPDCPFRHGHTTWEPRPFLRFPILSLGLASSEGLAMPPIHLSRVPLLPLNEATLLRPGPSLLARLPCPYPHPTTPSSA